jgi:predicted secreted Zn-dependent protease
MKVDLNIGHINKLFDLTELHLDWFKKYHPENTPTFCELLSINYQKIIDYTYINHLGEYDDYIIDEKLEKMQKAFNSLFEISEMNRQNEKININNILI